MCFEEVSLVTGEWVSFLRYTPFMFRQSRMKMKTGFLFQAIRKQNQMKEKLLDRCEQNEWTRWVGQCLCGWHEELRLASLVRSITRKNYAHLLGIICNENDIRFVVKNVWSRKPVVILPTFGSSDEILRVAFSSGTWHQPDWLSRPMALAFWSLPVQSKVTKNNYRACMFNWKRQNISKYYEVPVLLSHRIKSIMFYLYYVLSENFAPKAYSCK